MDADTLGGLQRVSHTLAQGLARRGYEVHLIGLPRSDDPVTYIDEPAYGQHEINPGRWWRPGAASAPAPCSTASPPASW